MEEVIDDPLSNQFKRRYDQKCLLLVIIVDGYANAYYKLIMTDIDMEKWTLPIGSKKVFGSSWWDSHTIFNLQR